MKILHGNTNLLILFFVLLFALRMLLVGGGYHDKQHRINRGCETDANCNQGFVCSSQNTCVSIKEKEEQK